MTTRSKRRPSSAIARAATTCSQRATFAFARARRVLLIALQIFGGIATLERRAAMAKPGKRRRSDIDEALAEGGAASTPYKRIDFQPAQRADVAATAALAATVRVLNPQRAAANGAAGDAKDGEDDVALLVICEQQTDALDKDERLVSVDPRDRTLWGRGSRLRANRWTDRRIKARKLGERTVISGRSRLRYGASSNVSVIIGTCAQHVHLTCGPYRVARLAHGEESARNVAPCARQACGKACKAGDGAPRRGSTRVPLNDRRAVEDAE